MVLRALALAGFDYRGQLQHDSDSDSSGGDDGDDDHDDDRSGDENGNEDHENFEADAASQHVSGSGGPDPSADGTSYHANIGPSSAPGVRFGTAPDRDGAMLPLAGSSGSPLHAHGSNAAIESAGDAGAALQRSADTGQIKGSSKLDSLSPFLRQLLPAIDKARRQPGRPRAQELRLQPTSAGLHTVEDAVTSLMQALEARIRAQERAVAASDAAAFAQRRGPADAFSEGDGLSAGK